MLRRHSEIFRSVLLLADVLLVVASWLGAYAFRFHSGLDAPRGVPPLDPYLVALGLIVPVWVWVFRSRGLYAPRRTDSTLSEIGSVLAGATTVVVLLVVATFFVRSYFFSRGVIVLFWALSIVSVSSFRLAAREFLRVLHRNGRNLRSVLVVGAGPLGTGDRPRARAPRSRPARGGCARQRPARATCRGRARARPLRAGSQGAGAVRRIAGGARVAA